MPIATATALAIGAMTISAGSAGASFIAAGKSRDDQRKAENKADLAMQDARKALETNFYAQQAIKKEPYELEREALLAAGAQAVEAGVESERGAAATAGKVQMAMNEGQAGIRTAMGREMTDLENKQLAEQSRLRDVGVQLDLGEVTGAQQAAAQSQQAAAQQTTAGIQGIASVGQQALTTLVPLYSKTSSAKMTNDILKSASGNEWSDQQVMTRLNTLAKTDPKYSSLAVTSPSQIKGVLTSADPSLLGSLQRTFNTNYNDWTKMGGNTLMNQPKYAPVSSPQVGKPQLMLPNYENPFAY